MAVRRENDLKRYAKNPLLRRLAVTVAESIRGGVQRFRNESGRSGARSR